MGFPRSGKYGRLSTRPCGESRSPNGPQVAGQAWRTTTSGQARVAGGGDGHPDKASPNSLVLRVPARLPSGPVNS